MQNTIAMSSIVAQTMRDALAKLNQVDTELGLFFLV